MTENLKIRPADSTDANELLAIRQDAIMALAEEYGRVATERWASAAHPDRAAKAIATNRVWVTESGSKVVGWVEVSGATIESLYVSSAAARQGVGSSLLAHAEGQIRDAGASVAYLDASPAAEAFYARRGYQRVGEIKANNAIPMSKRLDPSAGWSRLPEHWRSAFRQAWAAYTAGTIPVGAVVVDPDGVIAAEARNRVFDAGDPPPGQLAGSWLAHAEVNAIAQIDAERSRTAEGWAVYSTWEPCPLCAGAITVAFRGRITVGYAARDPVSSGLRVLTDTDIGRRRQWQIQQLRGPFAVFAELLLAVYTTEARPRSLTAARYNEPPWRHLFENTGAVLARGRDCRETVEHVVATIWAALEQAEADTPTDPTRRAG